MTSSEQTVDHEEPVELGTSLHALVHGPQEQEAEGEAQHVAELAGQGAKDVAAVDGVALQEEEQQSEHRRQHRVGAADAQQAGKGVGDERAARTRPGRSRS